MSLPAGQAGVSEWTRLRRERPNGGDILNVCLNASTPQRLNAIHAGSRDPEPAKWVVTEEMLVREIRRTRAAKARPGEKVGSARRIGFQG